MVSFCIQFLFLLFLVIFQVSFLNVVFSDVSLNAVLATAIAWTLTRGFFSAWPWVICLGVMFDMVSMDIIGLSSLVLILFSYGITFVSRRFLMEHKGSGMALSAVFMGIASVSYFPLISVVRHMSLGTFWSHGSLATYWLVHDPIFGAVSNALLFIMVYGVVVKINRTLDFYDDRVVVKR